MNNPNTNIPQGYKQTKVGIIPEDWEVKRLGEIGNFHKGKGIPKSVLVENGYNAVRYGEIYTNHHFYIKNIYSFISENTIETTFKLEYGDILFAGSGETLEEIGKAVAYISNEETYAGGDIIILRPNQDVANPMFLGLILNQDIYKRQTYRLGQGNSVVHIYSSGLKNTKLPIPHLPEQEKIADCLTIWDKAITQTKKLIEAKKQVKKGLMQQLLTGKKRLPGFTDEWKEVKFVELFQRIPSKTYQLQTKDYDFNGKYPIIDQGQKEIIGYSDIDKKVFSNVPIIVFGDHTRIYKYINFKFIIGADGVQLLKNKSEDNILFLYYLLSNTPIPNLGYSRHMRILKSKTFYIPSIKEQTAIAKILQTADKEIDLLEEKLKTLEQQKKGLMQVLLTGKKRLV